MSGSFELREHTADVAVEATGDSPGALFAAVADGLAAAMCDDVPETGGERFHVDRSAESLDGLLYDYLGALIYERDVRGVLPVDNEATVTLPVDTESTVTLPEGDESTVTQPEGDGEPAAAESGEADRAAAGSDDAERSGTDQSDAEAFRVAATARGVPLAAVSAREIKAVTYSEMAVESRDGEWYAYVVFDV